MSWRSKKQNIVARSTAEVEFRAMAFGLCELLWLKIVLINLRLVGSEPINCFVTTSQLSVLHII